MSPAKIKAVIDAVNALHAACQDAEQDELNKTSDFLRSGPLWSGDQWDSDFGTMAAQLVRGDFDWHSVHKTHDLIEYPLDFIPDTQCRG